MCENGRENFGVQQLEKEESLAIRSIVDEDLQVCVCVCKIHGYFKNENKKKKNNEHKI